MPVATLEIEEERIQEMMNLCHMTRDEAISLLRETARNLIQYQAYLESKLDPRD